jgi:hypothetical protein
MNEFHVAAKQPDTRVIRFYRMIRKGADAFR